MAFAVAAVVIVVLLFAVAVGIGRAQEQVVDALKAGSGRVKVWGGRILIAVGAWLAVLGIFAGTFARLFPV